MHIQVVFWICSLPRKPPNLLIIEMYFVLVYTDRVDCHYYKQASITAGHSAGYLRTAGVYRWL